MHFAVCLFGREGKVGAKGLRAKFARAVVEGRLDEHDVAALLLDAGAERDLSALCAHGAEVARLHFRGHAGRLQLAHHHPAANLVEQHALNAAVQCVEPALEVRRGLPKAHDVVAVLKKLHFHAERVARRTAEAVVAVEMYEGIYYLFHFR